jgi:tRNA threonylcarbamoyladenosine biosynthesis protein TsaE
MPILEPHSVEFISRNTEQTRRLGMRLGAMLQAGDVVCLSGDLGSGKTTLVQGLAAGWGSLDSVSSPTFVLVNVYRRYQDPPGIAERQRKPLEQRLYHLDAYRLSGAGEAEDLDLDMMLEGGLMVVEWADRIRAALPDEHLWINLRWINPEQRDMLMTARGGRYQKLLAAFRKRIFGLP